MIRRTTFFIATLILTCAATELRQATAQSEADVTSSEPDRLNHWLRFYLSEAEKYDIHLQSAVEEKFQLHRTPMLRWASPTSSNEFNGAMFVWTHNEQPQVVGAIWSVASKKRGDQINIAHTFHSLSQYRISADRMGEPIWHPIKPGVSFQAIPNAPEPSSTPNQRQLQIRMLSKKFTADQHVRRSKVERLRMLPRPVHVYNAEGRSGAIFAFLRDWDPEIMLAIESQPTKDGPRWSYTPFRFCSLTSHVYYDGQEVWSYQRGGPMEDPDHVYFSMHGATIVSRSEIEDTN